MLQRALERLPASPIEALEGRTSGRSGPTAALTEEVKTTTFSTLCDLFVKPRAAARALVGRSRRMQSVGPLRGSVRERRRDAMDDKALQDAVIEELEWDPSSTRLTSVSRRRTGRLRYGPRVQLRREAGRGQGYRARRRRRRGRGRVEVRLPSSSLRDDTDIAESIARALRSHVSVPDSVDAEVRHGFVTLRGEVDWSYQREAAERVAGTRWASRACRT